MGRREARSASKRGWVLSGLLLLLAACVSPAAPSAPTALPTAWRSPTATTSRRPTPSPIRAVPTVTLAPSPTEGLRPGTPTPTPEPVFFVGECRQDSTDLCLRSWAWVTRGGQATLRYVFFHARYPDALKVRINGMQLDCAPLPERQQDKAVVCYGKPLGSLRGVVRFVFAYFLPDGRVLEGTVPEDVRPLLSYIFPVWFPPTPTPEE